MLPIRYLGQALAQKPHILDNEAVINALGTKSFKDTSLMNMLHCLFFFQAYYSFLYTASHLDNTLADALSCNNATVFLSKVPNVDKTNPCQ